MFCAIITGDCLDGCRLHTLGTCVLLAFLLFSFLLRFVCDVYVLQGKRNVKSSPPPEVVVGSGGSHLVPVLGRPLRRWVYAPESSETRNEQ